MENLRGTDRYPRHEPRHLRRIQINLDEPEYKLAKMEAAALGVSLAEFVRRADREKLSARA
jgi:hypothetical protein